MGAASAASQSSAMPQSQGKGGGAPTGGSGVPMSGVKGFSNQQPYSPNSGAPMGGVNDMQYIDPNAPNDLAKPAVGSSAGPLGQYDEQLQPTPANSEQGMQLPQGGQQGWQPQGGGKNGHQITYPSTSGQQQFGQPMQSTQNPYSNTIGQGQQSNQMGSSGKGKGA